MWFLLLRACVYFSSHHGGSFLSIRRAARASCGPQSPKTHLTCQHGLVLRQYCMNAGSDALTGLDSRDLEGKLEVPRLTTAAIMLVLLMLCSRPICILDGLTMAKPNLTVPIARSRLLLELVKIWCILPRWKLAN